MQRAVSILVLLALLPSAVFGGIPQGAVVLCLGGEHGLAAAAHDRDDHAGEPTAPEGQGDAGCSVGCDHHADWPLPRPVDALEHDCPCIDVDMVIVDLASLPRPCDDVSLPAAVSALHLGDLAPLAVPPSARLHRDPGVDPGGDERLRRLRTTRLLI